MAVDADWGVTYFKYTFLLVKVINIYICVKENKIHIDKQKGECNNDLGSVDDH